MGLAVQPWRKVPWLSLEKAKAEIAALTDQVSAESSPRTRMKLGRRLAFAGSSMAFSEEAISIPDLEQGITALRLAKKSGAVTDDLNRSLAWLSKRRLEAMGFADAKVIAEKKKKVMVDAACLMAAPGGGIDPEFLVWPDDQILRAMNEGRFFLASFGSDGSYSVAIRWVDAIEPVLKSTEYENLEASSDIGFLRIESAELRFGAPERLEKAAVLDVPKGLMKVQIFCLLKRNRSRIVLVACRTDEAPSPLVQMQELGW